MELLTNIIVEYLKYNKRLVVPKFGAFIVKQAEGKLMFSELMRNDDGVLRSLLMAYGINEIEASGMIDRLVFEIRHAISQGESFTIEGLGSFSAGDNNTITFKQYREPRSVGGNIRPPFEHLDEAKRTLQRTQGAKDVSRGEQQRRTADSRPKSQRPAKPRVAEDENMVITKPESYLRGLKYENKKSKGHDEEYYRNDKRKTINIGKIAIILVVVLILGGAGWLLWSTIFNNSDNAKPKSDAITIERMESHEVAVPCDTIPTNDSIPVNDTMVVTMDRVDVAQETTGANTTDATVQTATVNQ